MQLSGLETSTDLKKTTSLLMMDLLHIPSLFSIIKRMLLQIKLTVHPLYIENRVKQYLYIYKDIQSQNLNLENIYSD